MNSGQCPQLAGTQCFFLLLCPTYRSTGVPKRSTVHTSCVSAPRMHCSGHVGSTLGFLSYKQRPKPFLAASGGTPSGAGE